MKKRLPYIIGFLVLLGAELFIGAFVRDDFIRPYVGDILVTVLLCCLAKSIFPDAAWKLPVLVFGFSAAVELVQLLALPRRLGLEGTVFAIALGSTFDWADLVCYLTGCILFQLADTLYKRKNGVQ